jgi:hypothetical protein
MNAQNFCYWLQGYSEIDGATPNAEQWQVILDHLKIVEELKKKPENLFAGLNWETVKFGPAVREEDPLWNTPIC